MMLNDAISQDVVWGNTRHSSLQVTGMSGEVIISEAVFLSQEEKGDEDHHHHHHHQHDSGLCHE